MMRTALLVVVAFVVVVCVSGYGEPNQWGRPTWQERANHYFANAVRISPSGYKTTYMAGFTPSPANILGSQYPAKAPYYLISQLVESAWNHSNDMAISGKFQHASSDNTPTFTRVKYFYTCSGTLGENIAAGNQEPLATNNQWLCDETNSACAADMSANDGHRKGIMNGDYKAIGVGYYYLSTATYRHYWTQDFGGATCNPTQTSPIYSGSHYFAVPATGKTRFVTVFYTSPAVAPTSASVVIAGTSNTLTLELGVAGAGTYVFEQTSGSACRSYYFVFVAGGTTYRFPDTGCLTTFREGSCTASFDASCAGGGAATTGAATTAAATTAAATTAAPTTAAATTAAATTATTAAATTRAPTTAAAATTSTTKAATTGSATTGGSTTGTVRVYNIYTTSFQDSWSTVKNSKVTLSSTATYLSQTCVQAGVTAVSDTNNSWFAFYRATSVSTSGYTTLQFNVAASYAVNLKIFFNGGYTTQIAATTSWAAVPILLTTLGSPTEIGNPKYLIVSNTGANPVTIYINNVRLQ